MKLPHHMFEQFQGLVAEASGIYIKPDRSETLEEKLSARMEACHIAAYQDYFHYLQCNSRGRLELQALLDLLTIGETHFFRNGAQFDALRDYVIPKLIQEKTKGGSRNPTLRIWSAGCSTGEEPYSIAMIMREFRSALETWDVSILATDINRHALEAAQGGVYGHSAVQRMPPAYRDRYFVRQGQTSWLSDDIKNMVQFHHHNLARDPYTIPGMRGVDVLFCRNVTIYFGLPTLKRVISWFADCFAPEGFFFIGHAETLWGISNAFRPIEFSHTFLYQKLAGPAPQSMAPPSIPLPTEVYRPQAVDQRQGADLGALQDGYKAFDQKDYVMALQIFDAHLRDQPADVKVLMAKGTILANQGHYTDALHCFQRIIARDNLYAPAYYLVGVLRTKMGQHEKAIEEFRRILYIDATLSVCYLHLGDLYRFLGRPSLAHKEYLHCLKLLGDVKQDSPVPLSEELTAGVLYQAVHRALESLRV